MVMKEKKLDIGIGGKQLSSEVFECAEVVKLVDAVDSKSSELTLVPVRVRPSAPKKRDKIKPKMEGLNTELLWSLDYYFFHIQNF